MKIVAAYLLLCLRAGTAVAQACSGTVTTITEEGIYKNQNSCGLNRDIITTCAGTIVLNNEGTGIYAIPVGAGHGDVQIQLFATGFTGFMSLEGPDGCGERAGCIFADSASRRGATVFDILPSGEPEGTYYLFVGDATHEPLPLCGDFTLVVTGNLGVRDQTVFFRSLAPTNAIAGGEYEVFARASSGLPITWSIDTASTSDCNLSFTAAEFAKVDFTRTGSCTININQPGNAGYNPAAQAQQTFVVHPARPSTSLLSPNPPLNGVVGAPLLGTLWVTEYDSFGNVVTTDETSVVSLSANGAGHLQGDPVAATVIDGVASFNDDLVFDTAGDYTLTASDSATGVIPITSASFSIAPAGAASLQFTPAPASSIERGMTLGSIVVTEVDQFGNRMAADNSTMVKLSADSCGGIVLGTQSLTAGQATFATTQVFRNVATGVVLSAAPTTGSVPTAASATFDVDAGSDFVFFDGYEFCEP